VEIGNYLSSLVGTGARTKSRAVFSGACAGGKQSEASFLSTGFLRAKPLSVFWVLSHEKKYRPRQGIILPEQKVAPRREQVSREKVPPRQGADSAERWRGGRLEFENKKHP